MKLAKLLFKPKWQDKNADVRRAAVANDSDPDLLAELPELTRADPEPSVRLAALKRLNDYELWRERSTNDADLALRKTARATYITQLCADLPGGPGLTRRIAELETLAADELERVASSATHRELRADALTRIGKPNFLAERALRDTDATIRFEVLQRIGDPALLEKIAERARKTDKIISRRARELAEAARVSRGDAKVIADRARILCDRAESIMRSAGVDRVTHLAAIDDEWRRLGPSIPADLTMRYEGARAVILAPPPARAPVVETVVETVVEPIDVPPPVVITESLASRSRFDGALAAAQAETQRLRNIRDERMRELADLLLPYEAAIDAGDSATSLQFRSRIDALVTSIGDLPPAMQHALSPLHDRSAELQRWLQWSANQRRKAICSEIESLSSTLHPDALASRIREFRDEWQKLAMSSATPEALEKRFQGLSHQLLKTTRPYFDKRDELRRSQSDALQQLLARADAVTADDADWKAMTALRTELSGSLRNLDRVDPRERTGLAKRIKAHLDRFDARITERGDQVMNAKTRLIERAKALADIGEAREVARQARALQTEWTALGNGRRNTDQKQWREFRSACDAAFGKLDAQRKERDEQGAAQLASAASIVEEAEALAASDASADVLRSTQREIDTRWHGANIGDRTLEQRYRQARDSVSRSIADWARKSRLGRFTSALDRYRTLRDAESGRIGAERLADLWPADEPETSALLSVLKRRREQWQNPAHVRDSNVDAAANLLIRLEYIAGVESPPEDRQRRMDYQVQKLSSRLRGGTSTNVEADFETLLTQWFALNVSTPTEFDERFHRASAALLDNLP